MAAIDKQFYTLKGYQQQAELELTSSMEDYLEMICRLESESRVVRINALAQKLNVKPSSASKMVQNLKESGYITFHKYGYIETTPKGQQMGFYLLRRHKVLHEFLCILNHSEQELEQVEKIEHFMNRQTVENLEKLTQKLREEERKADTT